MEANVHINQLHTVNSCGATIVEVDYGQLQFGIPHILIPTQADLRPISCEYGPFPNFYPADIPVKCMEHGDTTEIATTLPIALRYLRLTISASDGKLEDVRVEFQSYEHTQEQRSSFWCSDALVNRIWEVGAKTIHLCRIPTAFSYAFRRPEMDAQLAFSETWRGEGENCVLVDGPRRDKEVWVGDLLPEIRSCISVFGDFATVRNSLQLFTDLQHADGFVPASSVSQQYFLEYCCWYCVCMYEYFLLSGDMPFLQKNADAIWKAIQYVIGQRQEDGLLTLGSGQTWAWTLKRSGKITSSNCVQVWALRGVAKLCTVLGYAGRAEELRKMADATEAALRDLAYDKENGVYRDTVDEGAGVSIDSCALAVLSEVASDDEAYASMRYVEGHHGSPFGYHTIWPREPDTGSNFPHNQEIWPFANQFLLDALYELGLDAEAFALLKKCWGTMAKQSETFWEIIDHQTGAFMSRPLFQNPIIRDTYNSACHGWSAGVNYSLMTYVAGIYPVTPGYAQWEFAPHPCGMERVSARLETAKGAICVTYQKLDETQYEATLDIPEGAQCCFQGKWLSQGHHTVLFGGQSIG